jgi:hypothetical protein
VGLGTCFGCIAALYYDTIAPRLSAKHPAKKPEYLRLPLACAAAPFFVVSLLWLGWTSRKDIHLMVPLAALLPYGFAYQLIFVAMINVSGAPTPFSFPPHHPSSEGLAHTHTHT